MELDFRAPLIRERLSGLKLVVPVASPKGGVGKTTIASALSVLLARSGVKTGVLDLDFTNPTTHIMLGVDAASTMPEEEKGVLPVKVEENLELMGLAFYTRDRPLPLRGHSIVDALREVLAITRWSSSVLVVDSPPGLSDALLEMLRLARGSRVLVVSACDKLSLVSTRRILEFLEHEGVAALGVVANMCRDCRDLEGALGVKPLDCVPRFEQLREGDRDQLAELFSSALAGTLGRVREALG